MPRTVTLTQVADRIRELGEISTTYVTNAALFTEINQSALELVDKLVSAGSTDYFESTNTQNIISGTSNYSLPADFYKMLGVDILTDNNTYVNVQRYSFGDRNRYNNDPISAVERQRIRYSIRGSNLILVPTPQWTEPNGLRMLYVSSTHGFDTANATPTNVNSTFDGILGWEDWIVYDCLIKFIGGKEEGDASQWAQLQAKLNARIEEMKIRDRGDPDYIRDIDTEGDWPWSRWG